MKYIFGILGLIIVGTLFLYFLTVVVMAAIQPFKDGNKPMMTLVAIALAVLLLTSLIDKCNAS